MSDQREKNIWGVGDAYEHYVGRWSRQVATQFLSWLAVPPGRRWLDVGCGTGALTTIILDLAAPAEIVGVDPSNGFVEHARTSIQDARASFRTGDARDLPLGDRSFDAVVSGLVLNFVPEPEKAVAEMARVARPGATVAAYVWDYSGGMQMMRYFWDAAIECDPAASSLDQGQRYPICRPDVLQDVFSAADLDNVEVRPIDIPTHFNDFDDYWSPFLGGQGGAPGYVMSLSEERRAAVRERLRKTLPVADDGSIRLIARAWAVRGIR